MEKNAAENRSQVRMLNVKRKSQRSLATVLVGTALSAILNQLLTLSFSKRTESCVTCARVLLEHSHSLLNDDLCMCRRRTELQTMLSVSRALNKVLAPLARPRRGGAANRASRECLRQPGVEWPVSTICEGRRSSRVLWACRETKGRSQHHLCHSIINRIVPKAERQSWSKRPKRCGDISCVARQS